ncbi:MAG: heavy-metal-associated domain-containing protein [Phascolarctobacterium sp.]|nr:heavy-metal-associated domain-containing protein [Candidatus Phascolarctobacterium caballi]
MKTVQIEGMHCQHCVAAVKGALEKLNFQRVQVSLENNNAVIWDDKVDEQAVRQAIEELGFDVTAIK